MEDGFICVHLRHLRMSLTRQARDIRGNPGGETRAGPAGETPALRRARALFM
jgi:hypothetical protein